tara:strand:+ start:818 stop:3931 length:3114 start_codon:yes stop_codon:yes gene_type:complete
MKIGYYNIVLFLLFTSHVGIGGTEGYFPKKNYNYNCLDSGKINQPNLSLGHNSIKYNYLDSGEYYLDSNFNIDNLFADDTIAKDLEIKFVKNKITHIVGESYFNVCKIKNKTNKILDLDFRVNMPVGWELLNSSVLFSRSIIPGGEINLPLRLTIPQNVMGGIAYVVNLVASTTEKEFFGATYIKLAEISDWNFEATNNKIYFNELYNTERFEIYLSNKGNTIENLKLNFKIGKKLRLSDSVANYKVYISMLPYSDTVLSFQVQKSDAPEGEGRYVKSWNENEILVTATGRNGKTKSKNFRFFDLDNEYYNMRNESYSPLNLSLLVFNLASGFSPSTNFRAFGQVQLNQSHELNYSLNLMNLSFQEGFNLRDYLNNPFSYNFSASHNWDNKLNTTVGNIVGRDPLFSQFGRGVESSYKINNSSSVGITLSKNMFFPSWSASSYYKSNILVPFINKTISYNFKLFYQENDFLSIRSISPKLGLYFSPIKDHNISLNIMPSFGNYDTTLGSIPNQDSSINGASYQASYSGTYKNITARVSYINSKNSLLNPVGRIATNSNINYKINKMSSVNYTSTGTKQPPTKLFFTRLQSIQLSSWNNHRLYYQNRINEKFFISFGPNIQTSTRQKYSNQNTTSESFSNQTFGLLGLVKFKLNELESISPNIFLGNTRFFDNNADSINYNGASNISLGINYIRQFWGLNFRYIKGATFFLDQSTFVFEDSKISNETIFLRANFSKKIPSRNLDFEGFANYFLRMPRNVQSFGLTGRMNFQIIKRLNGFAMANIFTNSLSNQEDGTSSSRFFSLGIGLTYNVDVPQPKIKYHNLKIICFEDLNGDNMKDENEPAIPNIILKISRDLESDFLNTPFSDKELISDIQGNIVLNDLPEGDFFLSFRSLENLGVLYNINGNEEEISLEENYTLFVPYGEGYKVRGRIKVSRDVNSNRGTVNPGNIRVEALSTSGEVFSALTDANGYYSVSVPHKGYFRVSMSNIFGDDFYIKNNKTLIQFDGFKLFKVDFDVVEKSRDVKINGNAKFNFGSQ